MSGDAAARLGGGVQAWDISSPPTVPLSKVLGHRSHLRWDAPRSSREMQIPNNLYSRKVSKSIMHTIVVAVLLLALGLAFRSFRSSGRYNYKSTKSPIVR